MKVRLILPSGSDGPAALRESSTKSFEFLTPDSFSGNGRGGCIENEDRKLTRTQGHRHADDPGAQPRSRTGLVRKSAPAALTRRHCSLCQERRVDLWSTLIQHDGKARMDFKPT